MSASNKSNTPRFDRKDWSSDEAAKLGTRDAREVTEAIACNPIAVLVPCHRVIKKDGSISGYRWGVKRKRELLRREKT